MLKLQVHVGRRIICHNGKKTRHVRISCTLGLFEVYMHAHTPVVNTFVFALSLSIRHVLGPRLFDLTCIMVWLTYISHHKFQSVWQGQGLRLAYFYRAWLMLGTRRAYCLPVPLNTTRISIVTTNIGLMVQLSFSWPLWVGFIKVVDASTIYLIPFPRACCWLPYWYLLEVNVS